MNTLPSVAPGPTLVDELTRLRDYWRWFFALGVAMVVLGTLAIGWACIVNVTVAATLLFGFILLASGISQVVNSFWAGRWSGMMLHLLVGVLYTLVGLMIIDQPENSAIQLTLLIAIFLIISGAFRIVYAISERFAGWGWVLLNGGVTLLLGLLIYKQWPSSGLWVIGLFVGIDLILNGWAWIALSLSLRKPAAA